MMESQLLMIDDDDDDDDEDFGGINVSQSSIDDPIYPHFEDCLDH